MLGIVSNFSVRRYQKFPKISQRCSFSHKKKVPTSPFNLLVYFIASKRNSPAYHLIKAKLQAIVSASSGSAT